MAIRCAVGRTSQRLHLRDAFANTPGCRRLYSAMQQGPSINGLSYKSLRIPPSSRKTWRPNPRTRTTGCRLEHTQASPDMSEKTRSLMRLLPNSVVVCTSAAPASPPAHFSDPHAMTISSLASVSLGGEHGKPPVISFNVKTPSHTLDSIMASRRFNIHVLAGNRTGATVANWFARPRSGPLTSPNESKALERETGCVLRTIATSGAHPTPMLWGEGVLYVVRCQLLEDEGGEAQGVPRPTGGLVRVRDHAVVFGEVLDIIEGSTVSRKSVEASQNTPNAELYGLAYVDRHYAEMSRSIEAGPEAQQRRAGQL